MPFRISVAVVSSDDGKDETIGTVRVHGSLSWVYETATGESKSLRLLTLNWVECDARLAGIPPDEHAQLISARVRSRLRRALVSELSDVLEPDYMIVPRLDDCFPISVPHLTFRVAPVEDGEPDAAD